MTMKESCWNTNYKNRKKKIRVSQSRVKQTQAEKHYTDRDTGNCTKNAIMVRRWDHGSTVVKVLCYKSEGRWFDGIFHWHNPSDRTMALGSTQPLTEMSTRSTSSG